ncbi:MAG: VWD domain-containing protein [Thermoleophilia bacterium]
MPACRIAGLRQALVACLAAALLIGLASAAQAALVPGADDLPGSRSVRASVSAPRAELAGPQRRPLRRAVSTAPGEARAFRVGATRVSFAAITLASPAQARSALKRWRTVRRARALPVGDGGAQRVAVAGGRTTVLVALRVGRALGLVRYELPRRDARAAALGAAYGRLLAARLEPELALTPLDRAVRGALVDGTVSKGEALRAFALTYGGLPGVRVPPAGREPAEGSLALRWILPYRDELTPAQQAAVAAKLDAPLPQGARGLAGPGVRLEFSSDLTAQANGYLAGYLTQLGSPFPGGALPFPIYVYRYPTDVVTPLGIAAADATPIDDAGTARPDGTYACRIRLMRGALAATGAVFDQYLAHEVFHCVQFALIGPTWPTRPNWVIEGTADWASTQLLGTPYEAVSGRFYPTYLQTPDQSLFGRAYDAIGFFGAVDQHAGSLWSRLVPVLQAPTSDLAFGAAGAAEEGFAAVWASGLLRRDPGGGAWFVQQPWAVGEGTVATPQSVISDDGDFPAPEHGNRLARVAVPGDRPFVTVGVDRVPARIWDGERDIVVSGPTFLCVAGRCVCEPDEIASFPPFADVNGTFVLALSGWIGGSEARISFRSQREFCRPREERPSPGGSIGDPHLITLDGLHYEFQAAGEFVLVRSASGDLEIQARQEPWKGSRRVTVNTQLAFRVAGTRVVVDARGGLRVLVDGKAVAPGQSIALGGGEVSHDRLVGVRWPDGSSARVVPIAGALSVLVTLAATRAGKVSGLLGDFDGDPADDLAARDGERVAYTYEPYRVSLIGKGEAREERTARFRTALYDRLGDSWRLRQRESLLDYRPGETTATFTDRTLPAARAEVEDVPRATRQRAERICRARGIVGEGALDACIVDVALTGEEGFADAVATGEQLATLDLRRLAWGADLNADVELARTPDGSLHLASEERDPDTGAYRQTSARIAPDGTETQATILAAGGWPSLAAAPDGTLLATSSIADPAAGQAGLFGFAAAPPFAAWGGRQLIAQGGTTFVGEASSLFLPDGTRLTVSPGDGTDARVYRGFAPEPLAAVTPFSSPLVGQPGCRAESPALAAEGGTAWLAWIQAGCDVRGVLVAQVDPAQVGAPEGVVAASRVAAPASSWPGLAPIDVPPIGYFERIAVATRPGKPGVFVAYPSYDGARWRVLLWRVGAPKPVVVASGQALPSVPRLAADPASGRLWIAWGEGQSLVVQQTGPDGLTLTGAPLRIDPPPGAPTGRWTIGAATGSLDVVFHARRSGSTPGGVWVGSLAG